jgi:hypothetical protein
MDNLDKNNQMRGKALKKQEETGKREVVDEAKCNV